MIKFGGLANIARSAYTETVSPHNLVSPQCADLNKPLLLPFLRTLSKRFRFNPHIAPLSRMMAPDRCGWCNMRVNSIQHLDLFPATSHFETLVLLEIRKGSR